ncbi:MAG: hypothetical protein KBF87_10795 [Flavobacteriales bacterium]|nr:hypothetical protein [Flavobacteriales bacterium]
MTHSLRIRLFDRARSRFLWLFLAFSFFGLPISKGQNDDALSRTYQRATDLLTAQDDPGMFRFLDSLQKAVKEDEDLALLHDLLTARHLRYLGRNVDAYHALDSLAIDTAHAPALLLFSWNSELAQNLRDMDMHEAARKTAHKALSFATQLVSVEQRVNTINILGEIELQAGLYDDAMAYFVTAEKEALEKNYPKGRCNALIGIGNVFYQQERDSLAYTYYVQALEGAQAAKLPRVVQSALFNAGASLSYTEGPEAAIALYRISLLLSPEAESADLHAAIHLNIGSMYSDLEDHGSALLELDKAYDQYAALQDSSGMAKAQLFRATALWALSQQDRAIEALRACQRLTRSPRVKAESAGKAAGYLREMGRLPEALAQLDIHRALTDSLSSRKHGERIARVEVQYGVELKDRKIKEQALSLELERTQKELGIRQRNISVLMTVGAIIIALLFWRSLLARRKLANQEQELHTQRIDELMNTNELTAMNSMIEGQEKERDRVAKDLHDRLGSMLSAIKHQLGAVETDVQQVKKDQGMQYSKMHTMLDEAVGEVRRISHDMITVALSRFGLTKALEDLCDTVRVKGKMDVELQLFGLEQRMERSMEIAVYRIVQEAISNVLKHAKASELSVDVTRGPGRISVIVHDNGKGFDPAIPSTGIGMENMRNRAMAIGAVLRVDSSPGNGTTISVEGPVVE